MVFLDSSMSDHLSAATSPHLIPVKAIVMMIASTSLPFALSRIALSSSTVSPWWLFVVLTRRTLAAGDGMPDSSAMSARMTFSVVNRWFTVVGAYFFDWSRIHSSTSRFVILSM